MARQTVVVPNVAPVEDIANAGVEIEQHPDLGILVRGNLLESPTKQTPTSSGTELEPYGRQALARYERQTGELLAKYHGLSTQPRDMLHLLTFVPRRKQGGQELSLDAVVPRMTERVIANRVLAPEGGRVMQDSHWPVNLAHYVTYPEETVRIEIKPQDNNTIGILPYMVSTATPEGRAMRAVVVGVMEQYLREYSGTIPAAYQNRTLSWLLEQKSPVLFPDGVILRAAKNMGIANVSSLRNLLGSMADALKRGISDYKSPPEDITGILPKEHRTDPQGAYTRIRELVIARNSAQRFNTQAEVAQFLESREIRQYIAMPMFSGKDVARKALDRLATHLYAGLNYSR